MFCEYDLIHPPFRVMRPTSVARWVSAEKMIDNRFFKRCPSKHDFSKLSVPKRRKKRCDRDGREAITLKAVWQESHLRNQHCEPKKISVRKTQKPGRFLVFFMSFFKVEFKRYHFTKTTFGEDLN